MLRAPRQRPSAAVIPAAASELRRASRPCPPGKRNAVIAAAWGYGAHAVKPFMRSFFEAGLSAHTQGLLLVREPALLDVELKANAKRWGFWMLVADRDYDYTSRVIDELGLDPSCPGIITAATGRYLYAPRRARITADPSEYAKFRMPSAHRSHALPYNTGQ